MSVGRIVFQYFLFYVIFNVSTMGEGVRLRVHKCIILYFVII